MTASSSPFGESGPVSEGALTKGSQRAGECMLFVPCHHHFSFLFQNMLEGGGAWEAYCRQKPLA